MIRGLEEEVGTTVELPVVSLETIKVASSLIQPVIKALDVKRVHGRVISELLGNNYYLSNENKKGKLIWAKYIGIYPQTSDVFQWKHVF